MLFDINDDRSKRKDEPMGAGANKKCKIKVE
jgi:hypothetical protein